MAKETAEEKLLKMMQKSGAPVSAKAVPSAVAAKKSGISFSIRLLNQILFLAILLCGVGFFFEVQSGLSLIKTQVNLADDVKSSNTIAEIALPSSKDAKFYLEKIAARNIFRPYEAQAVKSVAVQNLAKRLSKYKIVGVAWLDLPETASIMIEDTSNKTTYFLKQGEQLEGVTVKTIYTDRAVFSYEHEETTIKL